MRHRENIEPAADAANFRHRVLCKLERDLGLPKLTFQVIRRTTATLAQKMGTVKDVQGLLRHSRTVDDDRRLHAGDSRGCALQSTQSIAS